MNNLAERTLIVIKPDGVKRGLVGTVIDLLEKTGLKLMSAKMVAPNKEVIKNHYPGTKEWISEIGTKTKLSFQKSGVDVKEIMKTDDEYKLGLFVYERLINYWQEGPLIAMVWEGPNAVEIARKLRGRTIPLLAVPGSLHATYSYDSSLLSAKQNRVVKTFVHASGSVEEAQREIKYWFPNYSFISYEREVDSLYL